MTDREISAGCVVAYGLWVCVVTLLATAWAVNSEGLGRVGLAMSAAAATATIRSYFVRTNKMIRSAFELGREAGVRNLR